MNTDLPVELIKEFVLASHFDLAKVKAMLQDRPDLLNVEYDWGPGGLENGIGAAAHVGNREIAEFFLAQGVPSNICVAAMLGYVAQVKAFLDGDPTLANAKGAHGIPVMFHAAMSGSVEVVELLKQYHCSEGYSFGLHGAIMHQRTEMVKWLLDNGAADLSVQDYQGKTPIDRALESNQQAIVEMLQQAGAVPSEPK
jgi:ankyrin repeat protein